MYTIANIVVSALLLFMSGFLLRRQRQHGRTAEIVFRVRPCVRILVVLSGVVLLVVAFPVSLILVGYIVSLIAVIFALDVVVERTGIYFGLRLLRWKDIATIDDHRTYLLLQTRRKNRRKAFLKFIWQIRPEGVGRLLSIFAAEQPTGDSVAPTGSGPPRGQAPKYKLAE